MKYFYILFCIVLIQSLKAQTFDTPQPPTNIRIDTTSIWQIGSPQKNILDAAFTPPNVLITDTINTYPINDTSSIIFEQVVMNFTYQNPTPTSIQHAGAIYGYHYVNTDTLNDYLGVEFSPDNGDTWYDLVSDSILLDTSAQFYWSWISSGIPPILSGNTNGWRYFEIDVATIWALHNVQNGDTVLYKFTFYSDSTDTGKDGVMFDNIFYYDIGIGVTKYERNTFSSTVIPNPAREKITIQYDVPAIAEYSLQIFDALGRLVHHQSDIQSDQFAVNTAGFDAGIYHYELKNEQNNERSVGRFVISP